MLRHPCLPGGPKRGRKCYVTPAFSGVPSAKRGDQNQKWPPHPCLLGRPKEGGGAMSPPHSRGSPTRQARGSKSEVATSPLPSREAKRGRRCYVTPAFPGGPKDGGNATSPLHSRGSPSKGNKIRSGCLIIAFSETQKRAEVLRNPLHSRGSPIKGKKIRSGCLTPAFCGAQKRAEMLRHPCISGVPNAPSAGIDITSGYLTPSFSGGPKEGGNAT